MNNFLTTVSENEGSLFHGLEIGSVGLKWAWCKPGVPHRIESFRHEGDPKSIVEEIFDECLLHNGNRVVVTGQAARALLDFSYRAETECSERALAAHHIKPDMMISLGGENFILYTMKNGLVRNITSTSRCAAGTGEFIVQQLQRMGLSLEEGIRRSRDGRIVRLSTRCSVYCKSDATHKLNKKECRPEDIAKTLIYDLACRVARMIDLPQWPHRTIVLSGGVTLNKPFVEALRGMLKSSRIITLDESPCLEAYGAMLFARDMGTASRRSLKRAAEQGDAELSTLPPLSSAAPLVDYRVKPRVDQALESNGHYIMGLDAGSTTTKAVLFNMDDASVGASCYLRTHGNPVAATKQCLRNLIDQIDGRPVRIVQAATTGSGRKITSVYLNNCLNFNEIMAHARAAAHEVPDVDTLFEIGGQDAKYISFQKGIPMDYAMNEGCSAGTGSFLEEAASVDMGIEVERISALAQESHSPLAFGERCAAFINTDLRNALQQGAGRKNVVAGLVYSIARNYLSRIVGVRQIGERLLFQGGVALNRSVAQALAALADRRIVVPQHPELMGCVGACLLARDRILEKNAPKKVYDLDHLVSGEMRENGTFRCSACENECQIVHFEVHGKRLPFGGRCTKYERIRQKRDQALTGKNLMADGHRLMFETYGAVEVANPRGTVGIPLALSTFAFFPFYAKLLNTLGYKTVLSEPSPEGNAKTKGPICYPCELAHGAVHDLLQKKVDHIFMPHVIEGSGPSDSRHSYICSSTAIMPHIVREAFEDSGSKLLSPQIGFSQDLYRASIKQIVAMGRSLKISAKTCSQAARTAYDHFMQYQRNAWDQSAKALKQYRRQPTVIVTGRPYIICSTEANLALPSMITHRGYHVIGSNALPPCGPVASPRDVWFHTQQMMNAVRYARSNPNIYLVLVSCFSCIPDASMYHAIREALSGRVFCYLEIDSHTAHAGFETRVEAFLDIVEETVRRAKMPKKAPGTKTTIMQAEGVLL